MLSRLARVFVVLCVFTSCILAVAPPFNKPTIQDHDNSQTHRWASFTPITAKFDPTDSQLKEIAAETYQQAMVAFNAIPKAQAKKQNIVGPSSSAALRIQGVGVYVSTNIRGLGVTSELTKDVHNTGTPNGRNKGNCAEMAAVKDAMNDKRSVSGASITAYSGTYGAEDPCVNCKVDLAKLGITHWITKRDMVAVDFAA